MNNEDNNISENIAKQEEITPEIAERYNLTNIVEVKKSKKNIIIKYGIIIGIMVLLTFSILVSKQTFYLDAKKDIFADLCDAFTVPGIVIIGIGLLVMCSNGGAFDMLVYGTKMAITTIFKKDPRDKKYNNFGDYRLAKQQKPAKIKHFMICGFIYFGIGLIFYLIYRLI